MWPSQTAGAHSKEGRRYACVTCGSNHRSHRTPPGRGRSVQGASKPVRLDTASKDEDPIVQFASSSQGCGMAVPAQPKFKAHGDSLRCRCLPPACPEDQAFTNMVNAFLPVQAGGGRLPDLVGAPAPCVGWRW